MNVSTFFANLVARVLHMNRPPADPRILMGPYDPILGFPSKAAHRQEYRGSGTRSYGGPAVRRMLRLRQQAGETLPPGIALPRCCR